MIDVLLIAEVLWVWFWVKSRSAERAILYVGAIFTSIFVAAHISPWFARRFVTSGSTFEWLRQEMRLDTHAVGLPSYVVPPLPTTTGIYVETNWIALHVLEALMTILMSSAIFLLFIVIEYLMLAFWDDDRPSLIHADRAFANIAGGVAAVLSALMTIWFMASLSWVSTFQFIQLQTEKSVFLTGLNHGLQLLPGLHIMLSWT